MAPGPDCGYPNEIKVADDFLFSAPTVTISFPPSNSSTYWNTQTPLAGKATASSSIGNSITNLVCSGIASGSGTDQVSLSVTTIVATLLPEVFYRTRDLFRILPIPLWTKPALGGLLVGLLALRLPQVLGGGYGWMQQAIDGEITLSILLAMVFAKMVAFSLTVSSVVRAAFSLRHCLSALC